MNKKELKKYLIQNKADIQFNTSEFVENLLNDVFPDDEDLPEELVDKLYNNLPKLIQKQIWEICIGGSPDPTYMEEVKRVPQRIEGFTFDQVLEKASQGPGMTMDELNDLYNSPDVQELLMGGGMMFGLPITPHPLPNKKGRITKREDVD